MNTNIIRCENDLQMYTKLLKDPTVKAFSERLNKLQENQSSTATRRHLLSTSVRLSRSMSGGLHKMADECIDLLQLKIPLELYAYASPQFNAACFKPEDGRLFVMFSSALLEAFDEKELMFVVGHELGHHVYRHHDIPIGYMLRGKQRPAPDLALQLFSWSRYAEVSADRAGAYCARDLPSVAKALFKLASGITGNTIVKFSFDDFLKQLDDMQAFSEEPGNNASMQDWFSTHPFSPLRVKALQHFSNSELMLTGSKINKAKLEMEVQDIMQLMEPNYLQGKTDSAKAMSGLFVAGAMIIARADGEITETEKAMLLQYFDDDYDLDKLDVERLKEVLPKRIKLVKEKAGQSKCMQLIRDLCLIANADGEAGIRERNILKEIAKGLTVPYEFVLQCLESKVELD